MADAEALIAELERALGAAAIDLSEADRDEHATDALGSQRGFDDRGHLAVPPFAVVRPRTAEEVTEVLRLANERRTPVVAYGGGTGLMGGARSERPGLSLDLSRLSAIRDVDAGSGFVWAEAGAVLRDVQAALDPHDLILGHDPWTFGIATVGGAISTNGLGFLGGKYGSMGDQVLGIEAALAAGTLVRTRPVRPRSTGVDLAALFVAGEGAFGIITAAALRTFPAPERRERAGFEFPTFSDGYAAIVAMRGAGIAPALLDLGERIAPPDDMPGANRRPWQSEEPTLFIGFDGFREEVDALLTRASAICREHGGVELDPSEAEDFWQTRHAPAESYAKARARRQALRSMSEEDPACFDYVHVSLPPAQVLRYRELASAAAARHGVHVIEHGVWVAPGLYSMIMVDAAATRAEAVAHMAAAVDDCLRLAHEFGGSMEYCHGAGVRLAHLMPDEHGAGLEVMRSIKRALDPHGILNPGKLGL
jgi:alkyldihydroxyacetonephosphate synthase